MTLLSLLRTCTKRLVGLTEQNKKHFFLLSSKSFNYFVLLESICGEFSSVTSKHETLVGIFERIFQGSIENFQTSGCSGWSGWSGWSRSGLIGSSKGWLNSNDCSVLDFKHEVKEAMTVELNLKFRKVKKMTFRKDVNELLIKKHSRKEKEERF